MASIGINYIRHTVVTVVPSVTQGKYIMLPITMASAISGKVETLNINVTEAQLKEWLEGMLIQDAMPQLTPAEREFLMTGITPKEWHEYFGATT